MMATTSALQMKTCMHAGCVLQQVYDCVSVSLSLSLSLYVCVCVCVCVTVFYVRVYALTDGIECLIMLDALPEW